MARKVRMSESSLQDENGVQVDINALADAGHLIASGGAAIGAPALTLGTANAIGAAATVVATDATILAFDATSPATQAMGDSAAVGSATVAARRDHKHAMPAFAAPTVALGTAAAAGSAATPMRSDATIAAFDATSPTTQAIGDSAAVGSAAFAARRDHQHAMPAFATNTVALGTAAAAGAAATLIRSDATILAFDATTPATQAIGDTGTVGVATTAARRDHKHVMPVAADIYALAQSINAQTGTTYTLVLGDAGKLVTLSNASAIAMTVDTNANVAFAVGTRIDLAQIGAGQVTVTAAGGVTINSTPTLKARTQYSGMSLVKTATNTWLLFGDLAAS